MRNSSEYFEYPSVRELLEKIKDDSSDLKKVSSLLNEIGLEYWYRQKAKRMDTFKIIDRRLFMISRLKYGI
jgi:hypothetical protein